LRLLVMNHSFEHDFAALREASPNWDWRVVDLDLFHGEAMRVLPPEVEDGLASYARPEYGPHRARWGDELTRLLAELWRAWPFDAFIAPSDSYFYLREARTAAHRIGIPFLVVQKETTIAPWNMEKGSAELREHAPLNVDHMTVCSDLHREYWLRAGARPEDMTVTGQPRFDFYASSQRVSLPFGRSDQPAILFFTYLPDFYHPVMVKSEGEGIWSEMLQRTEEELWRLAAEGFRVLVKPHPLQPIRVEAQRIRAAVGDLYGKTVFPVDPATDVRRLIAGADVAVGFQSTVMLEAMVAGLPVVYTFWDPEAWRIRDTTVPFHEWGHLIEVVEDADHFADAVRAARRAPWGSELWRERRAVAEPQLGSLDGGAARRTVEAVEEQVLLFRERRGTRALPNPPRRTRSPRLRRYHARKRAVHAAARVRRAIERRTRAAIFDC
jgi:hypothetical protein